MYLEVIKEFFPELEIKTTKLITDGWESDILIVNGSLVFRFPKKNGRFDCVYRKEKTITDHIRPFISIKISKIEIYENKEKIFSVLDFIDGEDFNKSNGDIVDDFTRFLKELHMVDVNILKNYNLDAENLPFFRYRLSMNDFSFDYDILSNILKKYKLDDDFNENLHIFNSFNYRESEDVLCHNDLHKGNLMINNGKLSGIIDFGDAIYTNYNIEFISIFKWRDKIIVDIVKKYEEITGRKLNIKFISAVAKLAVYSKISHNVKEVKKYLSQLKFYNDLIKILN